MERIAIHLPTIQKSWCDALLALLSCLLAILIFVDIAKEHEASAYAKPLKCKMCGTDFNYTTPLGNFLGNHCLNGSFGTGDYDCGVDSACFKMNLMHSDKSKQLYEQLREYFKSKNHKFSEHFLFVEGTVRGCIQGYGWVDQCHFYNSSVHSENEHNDIWTATNLCVCTTENCN